MNNLSKDTNKKIDDLVRRAAKKAGYNGGELTYQEHLQMKVERVKKKFNAKVQKQKDKLGIGRKNNDIAEEIKTYLSDSIIDLMAEGHTEEEALKITLQQFDEAELKPDFDSFMHEFNDFGMEENMEWYSKNGEAIGLFFAAFTVLGITLGALIGYFIATSWIGAIFGGASGMFIGVGLGLLSMAIMVSKRK